MISHFLLDPRFLLACAAGATAVLSGTANAQVTIASDAPSDPAYTNGWSAGANGGFGFTAWSFNGTYISATQHAMDSTSPYNHFGLAWTLYLPNGNTPGNPFPCMPPTIDPNDSINAPPGPCGTGPDLSRAGRGFAEGALQVGQTISVIVDNPTERRFYSGYTVVLTSGGSCFGYYPGCTGIKRLRVGTFEYFTYGRWYVDDTTQGGQHTTLFDSDTAAAGVRLDITLTDTNSYSLVMTPLANPSNAYTTSGTLLNSGPIDWIQIEHYNTDSDFFNASGPHVAPNPHATDLYIGGMSITAPDTEPPDVSARPAPNPSGKNIPGAKQTVANPNGFFELLAKDNSDPNPKIYISDSA